jgi:RNA polymerase sigma factor (sigma-70 family)
MTFDAYIQRRCSHRSRDGAEEIPWSAIEKARSIWLRRALRLGLPAEDAEDLFQDALLAAMEGVERLRIADGQDLADAFLGWFWGILRHKQVSHQRRRKRQEQLLAERAGPPMHAEGAGGAEARARLSLGLFARSSPEGADVLRRRFLEGRQLSELADDMGVSIPTACRRVQAALEEIRDCAELLSD